MDSTSPFLRVLTQKHHLPFPLTSPPHALSFPFPLPVHTTTTPSTPSQAAPISPPLFPLIPSSSIIATPAPLPYSSRLPSSTPAQPPLNESCSSLLPSLHLRSSPTFPNLWIRPLILDPGFLVLDWISGFLSWESGLWRLYILSSACQPSEPSLP